MQRISDITWSEIFEHWRAGEASNPGWVHTATVVKGWPDWESWRMFTANQLRLPQRTWQLFELTEPMKEIPSMLVGPYTGWQSRLPRPNAHTFAELIDIPLQREHFSTLQTIQRMMNNFPAHTVMTGLETPDRKIVLVEGHHRATAVALAQYNGLTTHFPGPVHIALAKMSDADHGLLDAVLARGSAKNPS